MHARRFRDQTNIVTKLTEIAPGNGGIVDTKQAFLNMSSEDPENIA
jgi:hypothetical protein